MTFNLAPIGAPGDPFGHDKPAVVDVPARATAVGSFKLPVESFLPEVPMPTAAPGDPFGDDKATVSPAMRFVKINLGPATRGNDFAGLGDMPSSTSSRFEKFNLPPMAKSNFAGLEETEQPDASFTKSVDTEFHKFAQFTKVQETGDGNVLVWGIATHEQPDLDGETCDYETAKKAYQDWSTAAVSRTSAAGQQISLGPIRYQHSSEPAGKATKIDYNDDAKEIWLGSVPIDDDVRKQLQDGFLSGYSQGGSYAWRRCADCNKSLTLQQANNYCPDCKKQVPVTFGLKRLSEVSYVDSPCTGKGFDYVKQDGSSRFVSFTKKAAVAPDPDGFEIIDSARIFGNVWKHVVQVAGRRRTVVMRREDVVLVA